MNSFFFFSASQSKVHLQIFSSATGLRTSSLVQAPTHSRYGFCATTATSLFPHKIGACCAKIAQASVSLLTPNFSPGHEGAISPPHSHKSTPKHFHQQQVFELLHLCRLPHILGTDFVQPQPHPSSRTKLGLAAQKLPKQVFRF